MLKRAPVWASVSLAVALSLAAADASAKPGSGHITVTPADVE